MIRTVPRLRVKLLRLLLLLLRVPTWVGPPGICNVESFLRFQLARKEHNASLNSNKLWAGRCPPTSSITHLTSCKNVVYQRYHAAKVAMFSESAKRIKDFLWLATKMPLRLWWRGKYQKNKNLGGCFCLYVYLMWFIS